MFQIEVVAQMTIKESLDEVCKLCLPVGFLQEIVVVCVPLRDGYILQISRIIWCAGPSFTQQAPPGDEASEFVRRRNGIPLLEHQRVIGGWWGIFRSLNDAVVVGMVEIVQDEVGSLER